MKKTIALLILNLVNYPLVLLLYIYGIHRSWFVTLIVLILNLSYTHKYYEILKFYKANGEEINFSVRYEIVDGLTLLAILVDSVARGYYDIKIITNILVFVSMIALPIIIHYEILIGKSYIYYKYRVLPQNIGKLQMKKERKKAYEVYEYNLKGKCKVMDIKKEYVKYFS